MQRQEKRKPWLPFRLKTKVSQKLSLGEYGRQRTSKKFHDLVLDLKFQNSRVLETQLFLTLFSQRKVYLCLDNSKKPLFENYLAILYKKLFVYSQKGSLGFL